MKIKGLKTFVANVSRTNFVFLKIYTDEGIDGVGEATLEWKTMAMVATLEELERVLIDKDPFQTDRLIETLHRDSYWRTGALFRTALGAVDAALLDIKGKALGVPVYELLGGKQRDRIACYANHWFFGAETPEQYGVNAKKAVAMGYKALKWDPFGDADLEMSPKQRRERRSEEIVAGGARRGGAGYRSDARRARTPQRAHRHRHVQGAGALRLALDRGTDATGIDRRAGRCTPCQPGADRGGRALVLSRQNSSKPSTKGPSISCNPMCQCMPAA